MAGPYGADGANRRHLPDRRTRPTTLRSALHWRGRRCNFRRHGEGLRAYVDCPGPRTLFLVCAILAGSALDAYFTLHYIARGGEEANPLMALALTWPPTAFTGFKMALTGVGAWFLAAHQQFPLAYTGLHGLAGLYLALCGYHVVLLL